MLAIDYFPLRRHERLGWGQLVWEKAPLFALALAVGLTTMITQSRQANVEDTLKTIPLSEHVLLMFQSLMFYIWKLAWPAHLSPDYPLSLSLSLNQLPVLTSVLGVAVITAVAVIQRRRAPALASAWWAYIALVLPVSGLFPSGLQHVAMRYAYVAMLPLLLATGGAAVWAWRRSTTAARVMLIGLLAGGLCAFPVRTRRLMLAWSTDENWWRTALAQFPDSAAANLSLTSALLDQGKAHEALEYAQRTVELAPQSSAAHDSLGNVLAQLGRAAEATQEHEEAVRLRPDSYQAHYNLGLALEQAGKAEDAVEQWQQAARLKPDFFDVHYNLGTAFARLGRMSEAVEQFEEAVQIENDSAEAHFNLGSALAKTGKVREAITHYEEAARIRPEYAEAQYNLANAQSHAGRIKEAVEHYEQVLRINPELADAQNNLAWLLATGPPLDGRDPIRAVELAQRACKLRANSSAGYLDTLAAAYAAAGRFDDAIATAEKAVELARASNESRLAEKIEGRLRLYRKGQAYRQPADVAQGAPD